MVVAPPMESCMKLHIYEHCPFCVRALMIVGLKKAAS